MIQILTDEYRKHRKLVLSYICVCIFLALFCGPFWNGFQGFTAYASSTLMSGSETISALVEEFVGGSLSAFGGSYSYIVANSCEPFTALFFIGLIENINRLCGEPLNIVSTPAGNPIFFAVIAVFAIASKLMKSFGTTKIFGKITLGKLEEFLGLFFVLLTGVLTVTGLTGETVAMISAASPEAEAVVTQPLILTVLTVVWSFVLSVSSVIVWFIVSTVVSGLDVLQIIVSTFAPGSTFVFEAIKTAIVAFLVIVNVIFPVLGFILNVIIIIISCILFKTCYRATRYFNAIYARPILRRIRGFDPNISIIHKRFPKKLNKVFRGDHEEVQLAIPVYPVKYLGNETLHKRDKWWLVSDGADCLYMRKRLGKGGARKLHFRNSEEQTVYIRKHKLYYEIFSYINYPDNLKKKFPKKEFSFVFSREYFYRIEDIVKITGYMDYSLVESAQKLTRKQRREEKRLQRKEFWLGLKEDFKQKRLSKKQKQEF